MPGVCEQREWARCDGLVTKRVGGRGVRRWLGSRHRTFLRSGSPLRTIGRRPRIGLQVSEPAGWDCAAGISETAVGGSRRRGGQRRSPAGASGARGPDPRPAPVPGRSAGTPVPAWPAPAGWAGRWRREARCAGPPGPVRPLSRRVAEQEQVRPEPGPGNGGGEQTVGGRPAHGGTARPGRVRSGARPTGRSGASSPRCRPGSAGRRRAGRAGPGR